MSVAGTAKSGANGGATSARSVTSSPDHTAAPATPEKSEKKGWVNKGGAERGAIQTKVVESTKALMALGLSSADVEGLSDQAKQQLAAVSQHALKGDLGAALDALKQIKDLPAAHSKIIFKNLLQRLPDGAVKTALQSEAVQDAAWAGASADTFRKLANPKEAPAALKAAIKNNPQAVQSLIDAVAAKPGMGALKHLGPGALEVADLYQALRDGQPIDPTIALTPEQSEALVSILPAPLLKQLEERAGLSRDDLKQPPLNGALPAVLSAASSFTKRDYAGGLRNLMEGAKPDVIANVAKRVSGKLGPLGPIVGDEEFVKVLAADPQLRESTLQLMSGKDVQKSLKGVWAGLANSSAGTDEARARFLGHAAGLLPEQHVKSLKPLLLDPELRTQLGTAANFKAMGELVSGTGDGRLRAWSTLAQDPKLKSSLAGAIGKDPAVQKWASAIGLEPAQLLDGKVGHQLVDVGKAISEQDFAGAATKIGQIGKENPTIAKALITSLGNKAKNPSLQTLINHEATQQHLGDPAVQQLVLSNFTAKLGEQGVAGRVESFAKLAKLPGLDAAVKAAVAQDASIQKFCDKLGVTPDAVFSKDGHFDQALPHLISLSDATRAGDVPTALKSLSALGKSVPSETKLTLAKRLAERTKSPTMQALLNDPSAVEALKNPVVLAEVSKLSSSTDPAVYLDVFTKLAEMPELRNGVLSAVASEPKVADKVRALGIAPERITTLGGMAVPVLKATKLASEKKWPEAINEITSAAKGDALPVARSILKEAAPNWATKLPPDSIAGAVLSDTSLVNSLVDAQGVDLKGLFAGTQAGVASVLGKPDVVAKLSGALWKTPAQRAVFDQFGFKSEGDVAQALPALTHLLSMSAAVATKNYGAVLTSLQPALEALPPNFSLPFLGSVIDKLPPGPARDMLGASREVLNDKTSRRYLLEGVAALNRKDAVAATRSFSELAQYTVNQNPQRGIALLNHLGKLPGGMGRLFANPTLNEALVKTNTLQSFLAGAGSMAQGDLDGSLASFAKLRGLVTSENGKAEYGKLLVGQVLEALPPKVKDEAMVQLGKMTVGAVAAQVPGVGIVSEVGMLGWQAWSGDGVSISLQALNLAASTAQTFGIPAAAFVRPITTTISAVRAAGKISNPRELAAEWLKV